MDILSPQIVEKFAADMRKQKLVPVVNMGKILGAEYQERVKRALADILADDPEMNAKLAEKAAHARLMAEGGNTCSPARAKELFQLPLTEYLRDWTPSAEQPSPPAITPRHEIRFAEARLEGGDLPFYTFSADEWLDIQTAGGQIGTNQDHGLREWRPEFYDMLITRLNAVKAAVAAAERIANKVAKSTSASNAA